MRIVSLELRERIVAAYEEGLSGSYAATAALFGVGEATVNRLLRRKREGIGLKPELSARGRKQLVDLVWLEKHAKAHPAARLRDRVDAWEKESGRRVHVSTMSNAMKRIGWTHKKRLKSPTSENDRTWLPNGKYS